MVFVSGIAGQLFRDQALTVTFAQLISLMVGITLVPMLTAWRARLGDKETELAPDAGEPRETFAALRRYLRAFVGNFNVHALVTSPKPLARGAESDTAFLRTVGRAFVWASRFFWWLVRYAVTFLVRAS